MPKLLQITVQSNKGSVGRIAEQIGEAVIENGWMSYVTSARDGNPSKSNVIPIGSKLDVYWHGLETRIFDNHSFSSKAATNDLIDSIKKIKPDILHLHNLHGYYINIEILFNYVKEIEVPVVWSLHDCWSFTGHCSHFEYVGCEKWKTECYSCEQKKEYPKSLFLDRSRQNFIDKKRIFNSVKNMTIVSVSNWLSDKVKDSFLGDYPFKVIHNGVDIKTFSPKESKASIEELYGLKGKFIILGVASTWSERKGLDEFVKLVGLIDEQQYAVVLVGLSENQIKKMPKTIIGIQRTENVDKLAALYSAADVFLNPTFEDTFPTTNLESLACGTPVITYKTGGSVESISPETGIIVEQGDVTGLIKAIEMIKNNGNSFYAYNCRKAAEMNFDKKIKFDDYLRLYDEILKK